jgi:phosphoglycolate phosphatase-like HAD superfamily hydrolase
MAQAPLLLLWDIDGTLLQRASVEHAAALRRAVEAVHGISVDGLRVEAAGRTDAAIARDLLEAAGVAPEAIDERAAEVRAAACRAFAELCLADMSHTVAAGVQDALDSLGSDHRQALLTGNFEPVARLKLARAGIGGHFPAGQGAFGSDAEAREDLPPVARRRAGGWPRERTLIIGDTPRDIACARADGVQVVAVATGPFTADELQDADHVAADAREVPAIVRSVSRRL